MASQTIVFWEVDAQRDFMLPGGNLYVPGAEKQIPNIKRLIAGALDRRVFLVSSADAHTVDEPEFRSFPAHCVKGTPGAHTIPEGLAENYVTIPNNESLHLPSDILRYPQIVFEKQTLEALAKMGAASPQGAAIGVATQ